MLRINELQAAQEARADALQKSVAARVALEAMANSAFELLGTTITKETETWSRSGPSSSD